MEETTNNFTNTEEKTTNSISSPSSSSFTSNNDQKINNNFMNNSEESPYMNELNEGNTFKKDSKKVKEKKGDWIVTNILDEEKRRQKYTLQLIPSENSVSPQVMKALGNEFTNKYSEGYPGNRFYGGQDNVDNLERLTQLRALKVFNLISRDINEEDNNLIKESLLKSNWGVNVQSLSGSPANLSILMKTIKPGDTIMGLGLTDGGHLSHGFKASGTGIFYKTINYGVNKETGFIDWNNFKEGILKNKPKVIFLGYSSYSRRIDWNLVGQIIQEVSKKMNYRPLIVSDISHFSGFVATGIYEDWKVLFQVSDVVMTTTHKLLRGPRGALIFYKKGDVQGDISIKRNAENLNLEKLINSGVFPGVQGGPHVNNIYAKCLALGENLKTEYKKYCENVLNNSKLLSYHLKNKGWKVITGGTDNHQILLDVTEIRDETNVVGVDNDGKPKFGFKKTNLNGKQAQERLEKVGIIVNKNTIPTDKIEDVINPSGIRLGTPSITTRGLGLSEIAEIANVIHEVLLIENIEGRRIGGLKNKIKSICVKFPKLFKIK